MRLGKAIVVAGLLLAATSVRAQTQPAVHHEANFDSERKQANDLFLKGDQLKALPLYEDLSRQDPTIAVFAERTGQGLVAAADIEDDPARKEALHQRSMAEFRRARQLGDDSPLIQTMLGMEEDRQRALAATKPDPPAAGKSGTAAANPLSSNPEALRWMRDGETAFAKNDVDTAFADYKKAAEIDPSSYYAKLFTGDACFRKQDFPCAGEWFAKAVALDPDRETAYRYWGDALYKSGHSAEAKQKYEEAIVAEPYSRLSWGGLSQWAKVTNTAMSSPPIHRATVTTNDKGGVKLNLPAGMADGEAGIWSYYGLCRISADAKRGNARRTAEGEVACLKSAADYGTKLIADGKLKPETLSPGVKDLLALNTDGMLECWVLLNGADQDVVQDYAAYRQAHRELLIAYLNKYVVP
jgi:tetratricopeptide (TPR) repeat protein